eukprot:PLAT5139.1.p1 GENE.PLAT5139.1~~PLAT5139.1.p1  ORF type:complete len:331 (-),score=161.48 PLAT5139.1:106-1098(-)
MGAAGSVIAVAIVLLAVYLVVNSIYQVQERQVVVIERWGLYHRELHAGIHFLLPIIYTPRTFSYRYFVTNQMDQVKLVEKRNQTRVSTVNEVLDFPRQNVITRDNALIYLDAVLSYTISTPTTMIYSTRNLPHMLSKLLQAQIRNVAGSLDVDQIIEDQTAMESVLGLMDAQAVKWGVKVQFVKIQKVEAGDLQNVLSKKKNADLRNKEIIISAKKKKQTKVIESEGVRDRSIREAEGEAQQVISRSRGQAQAILNAARAEARSIREISRALKDRGENPTQYLLALKYLQVLQEIVSAPRTRVLFLPRKTALLQTVSEFGFSTVMPPSAA